MAAKPALPAQDYTEIQNLYSSYNLSSDAGDAEAYASCFTRQGSLHNQTFGTTITGHADLVAFKVKEAGARKDKTRRHWNGSLHLELVGENAVRGRCYLHGYTADQGYFAELRDVAVYDDRIQKEDGEWKFAKRILIMDASARQGSKQPPRS